MAHLMSAPTPPSVLSTAMPTPTIPIADYQTDQSPVATKSAGPSAHHKLTSSLPLSPPPSPFSSLYSRAADPPLFSHTTAHDASDLRVSMFRPLVDVVHNASANMTEVSKDTRVKDEEYFQSTVYEQYSKSPKRWLQIQRELLKLYKPHFAATVISLTTPASKPAVLAPRSTKVQKQRVQSGDAISSPSMSNRNSVPSSPRSSSRGSSAVSSRPLNSIIKPSSTSPESSPRTSAVHDIDVDEIPDFCPPMSSLDNTRGMRTDWKGNQMDLSNDPDRHLLHPFEVQLASVLRLPCAMYLDSKKRIFAERVFRARKGLQFRRTDSQKACRIDVNKATRLFVAFEKVGWFEDKWLEPYL
ncbi:hypothetical protein V1512DRAFT_264783 [Lipomyces arxii]|uniref:uncharacterized protein n=1 Tax=Lipomyces arxii TaxID=56418 RepID=UPI0034CEFB0E